MAARGHEGRPGERARRVGADITLEEQPVSFQPNIYGNFVRVGVAAPSSMIHVYVEPGHELLDTC